MPNEQVSDRDLEALRTVADAARTQGLTLREDSIVGRMLRSTADELDALRERCEESGAALIKHLADKSA